jgi:hypothetical protein
MARGLDVACEALPSGMWNKRSPTWFLTEAILDDEI